MKESRLLSDCIKELSEARKQVVSCMKATRIRDEQVRFVPEDSDFCDVDSDDIDDMDSECDKLGI